MDRLYPVSTNKLRELRDYVSKTASFEKRASELESENDILRRTMDLVADGILDPSIALDKVAAFLQSPDDLRILELATQLDVGSSKLGSVVGDDVTALQGSESSEDRFHSGVADIVSDSGLSVI